MGKTICLPFHLTFLSTLLGRQDYLLSLTTCFFRCVFHCQLDLWVAGRFFMVTVALDPQLKGLQLGYALLEAIAVLVAFLNFIFKHVAESIEHSHLWQGVVKQCVELRCVA